MQKQQKRELSVLTPEKALDERLQKIAQRTKGNPTIHEKVKADEQSNSKPKRSIFSATQARSREGTHKNNRAHDSRPDEGNEG